MLKDSLLGFEKTKKYFYNFRTNEVKILLKEQSSKIKKENKININLKKLISVIVITGILIYFVVVLYNLIKEPTNIFMVENRNT